MACLFDPYTNVQLRKEDISRINQRENSIKKTMRAMATYRPQPSVSSTSLSVYQCGDNFGSWMLKKQSICFGWLCVSAPIEIIADDVRLLEIP